MRSKGLDDLMAIAGVILSAFLFLIVGAKDRRSLFGLWPYAFSWNGEATMSSRIRSRECARLHSGLCFLNLVMSEM